MRVWCWTSPGSRPTTWRGRPPITTFLLGFAAGSQDADPEKLEVLAAKVQVLADGWDRPADVPDPDDVVDEVPDDSWVDHTDDEYEEI
jgi:hypothetical protein